MFIPVELWFRAFLLTVAVEAPVVLWLLRSVDVGRARLVALAVFSNLVSHPAVWFVFTQLLLPGSTEYYVVAEAWAIVVEALFWWVVARDIALPRAFLVSLAANAASFIVGRLLAGIWSDLP